jgi:hypothetical protein
MIAVFCVCICMPCCLVVSLLFRKNTISELYNLCFLNHSFFIRDLILSKNNTSKIKQEIEKYKKRKKQKIINIIGIILTLLICLFCILFINVLAANFDGDLTKQWVIAFLTTVGQDVLVGQTIKCFIVFLVVISIQQKGVSKGKDQCLRFCANAIAKHILTGV